MMDELSPLERQLSEIAAKLSGDIIMGFVTATEKYEDNVPDEHRVDVFATALANAVIELFPGDRFDWFLRIVDEIKASEKLQ